jgi:hypothetical protein
MIRRAFLLCVALPYRGDKWIVYLNNFIEWRFRVVGPGYPTAVPGKGDSIAQGCSQHCWESNGYKDPVPSFSILQGRAKRGYGWLHVARVYCQALWMVWLLMCVVMQR